MAQGKTGEKRGFSIERALLLSVLFHAVLFLLSEFLPEAPIMGSDDQDEVRLEFVLEKEQQPRQAPDDVSIFDTGPVTGDEPTTRDRMPRPAALGEVLSNPAPDSAPSYAMVEAPSQEEVREQVDEPFEEEEQAEADKEPVDPENVEVEEESSADAEQDSEESGLELDGPSKELYREPTERPRLTVGKAVNDLRKYFMSGGKIQQPGEEKESKGVPDGMELPDLDNLPISGFGFDDKNLRFESGDYDWTDYARQIYMTIWRAWHRRLHATTDEFERWAYGEQSWLLRHSTIIRFTIHYNGQVTGVMVEDPSGCYPLDESASGALHEVVLPPLPEDFPRESETVHARFIAEGDIRTMRKVLSYYKSIGAF